MLVALQYHVYKHSGCEANEYILVPDQQKNVEKLSRNSQSYTLVLLKRSHRYLFFPVGASQKLHGKAVMISKLHQHSRIKHFQQKPHNKKHHEELKIPCFRRINEACWRSCGNRQIHTHTHQCTTTSVSLPAHAPQASVITCAMVTVKIKGTACGLYNVAPLPDHSFHKLQDIYSQLGSYTRIRQTLWQLYHRWETIVQAIQTMTLSWFIKIAPSWLAVKPLGYASSQIMRN